MKITKSQLLRLIKEETQGEMEFAELEAARRAYIEDKNDDTRHELGLMVEKLVEPIMAELGLFLEAEAFYSRGEIVFTNYKDMEVTIDPAGMMGRYDVQIYPLAGAEEDFNPVEISLDTMKGVAQFIYDLEDPHGDGMVGEPKAQTELPLEHKVRITKSQLQQIIKEEISRELNTENALSNMVNRLSKKGADIPRDKTVARMAYQLTYRDDGGESGVLDIYADSDDEAVEKAVERVKMMGSKYNQKFVVSRLVSPDGEIVAS